MSPQVMVDTDSSDEDGASDYRASKWLRARPRAVPEDALILTPAAALAAALAAYEADTVAFTSAQAWEDYGRKVPGMSDRGFKKAYNTKVRRSKLASTSQSASTSGTGLRSGNGERHFDTAAKAKAMAQTDKLHQTDTLGLLHGTPKPAPFKWAPPPYKAGESPSKYKSYSKSWRSHARVQHGLDGRGGIVGSGCIHVTHSCIQSRLHHARSRAPATVDIQARRPPKCMPAAGPPGLG
jgi:hypothetical protein